MTRRFPSVHPVLLVAVSVGVLWVVAVIRFRGWIATDDHAILQLGLEAGTWRTLGLHEGEAVFRPLVLPELEVPLAEVFRPTFPG